MDSIDTVLDDLRPIFQAADQGLAEWTEEGNMPFSTLLAKVAVRLNWDDKQTRQNDPVIRFYVRRHPEWRITPGAGGGCQRRSVWEKRNASKLAKEQSREQARQQVEANLITQNTIE